MKELKNKFKETIEKKLSNPDITTKEIQELACAYSELTKNDWMGDFAKNTSGLGMGYGGSVNTAEYGPTRSMMINASDD